MNLPPLPEIGPDGQRPVEQTIRVLIAHELIRSRMATGLSQRQLAVAAGVDARTVHSIESCSGRGSEQTMIRIRKALAAARTATPQAPTAATTTAAATTSPAIAIAPNPRPAPTPPRNPRGLLSKILRNILK